MDAEAMFRPLDPEKRVEAEPADKDTKTPIVPVPADAPPMRYRHQKLGSPSMQWPYHDAEGRLVGYVCRWDHLDAHGQPVKTILPITYCDLGNGRYGWRARGVPAPRPLMALPNILANPDAPILIVEGEKTWEAARLLFEYMAVTTPMHGAKSPHLTNFSCCAGRDVVIATDNDEAGRDFGDKVFELVRAAGAMSISHLRPDRLGVWQWKGGEKIRRSGSIPEGWDIGDALDDGWTVEDVQDARADPAFFVPYEDPADRAKRDQESEDPAAEPYTGPIFRSVPSGVEKRLEYVDKNTGITIVEWK